MEVCKFHPNSSPVFLAHHVQCTALELWIANTAFVNIQATSSLSFNINVSHTRERSLYHSLDGEIISTIHRLFLIFFIHREIYYCNIPWGFVTQSIYILFRYDPQYSLIFNAETRIDRKWGTYLTPVRQISLLFPPYFPECRSPKTFPAARSAGL